MMLLLLSILPLLASGDLVKYLTVTYPQGTVTGMRQNYGALPDDPMVQLYYGQGDVFLGIPFVQPPVGKLRFQKPVPMCTLPTNPYNATYYRPACPQSGGPANMAEDCLYLNVISPNINTATPYPVMVWIHGGSMKSGRAEDFHYKGAIRNLVSRGVVIVTIQYRLGMLGFFTTFNDDFPPNNAMLDQVEAIKWVKNNIQYFGGDPFRITMFGQSAGSASVSAHTYSPLSQNLFQGVIMESGTVLTCFEGSLGFSGLSQRRAQQVCNITLDQWNSNQYPGMKDCLMNADYNSWINLDNDLRDVAGWKMAQDNYFLPDTPANLAPLRPNINVMIGSNLDEWALFDLSFLGAGLPLSTFSKSYFEQEWGIFGGFLNNEDPRIKNILESVYTPPGTANNDSIAWLKINDHVFTCAGFTGFIGREVQGYLAQNNSNVYLYEYTYYSSVGRPSYQVPGWNPVPHAAEVPFVWAQEGPWNAAINAGTIGFLDYVMLDFMGQMWTDFAILGNPRRDNDWNPVTNNMALQYWRLDPDYMQMELDYRKTDTVVWNNVIPVLAGTWPPSRPDYNNGTNQVGQGSNFEQSTSCNYSTFTTPPTQSTNKPTTNTPGTVPVKLTTILSTVTTQSTASSATSPTNPPILIVTSPTVVPTTSEVSKTSIFFTIVITIVLMIMRN